MSYEHRGSTQAVPSLNTNAAYGNLMLGANDMAFQRGSGNFNPPPLWEQTTDRGPAYSQAANLYIDRADDRPKLPSLPTAPLADYAAYLDTLNKLPYSVGNTGMHPEEPGSWNRPNVDGVSARYEEFAGRASHLDPNTLMSFFFSPENVDYLQQRIVQEIKRIRKVDISPQSEDELLVIMNNHYQKALSGWLPHADASGKITDKSKRSVYPRGPGQSCSLTERLERLNKSVLEETVKQVLSGVNMYMQYYKDASSLPLPLERPTYTSMKGSNVLSERVGLDDNPHEFNRSVTSFNERYNIL